jgi:hypothetical protein
MAKTQKSINEDIKCKRDILAIFEGCHDAFTRKDICRHLNAANGGMGMGYSYPRILQALKELEDEGKTEKKWGWGVAGNWEFEYKLKGVE